MSKIVPEGFGLYVILARLDLQTFYYVGRGEWSSNGDQAVRYATIGRGNRVIRDLQRNHPNNKTRQLAKVEEYL